MFLRRFFFQITSKILMIVSEKSRQNLSDYIQLLFKITFEFNKKGIIYSEKIKNSMIMLTRSSERIFNPSRYTGEY